MAKQTDPLIDEPPIAITPTLVRNYGAVGAIFIQQLWYWQKLSNNRVDGKTWVYNSLGEWHKKTGLPKTTLHRIVKKLEDTGVIETSEHNKNNYDRTTWYHLKVDKVRGEKMASQPISRNGTLSSSESEQAVPDRNNPVPNRNKAEQGLAVPNRNNDTKEQRIHKEDDKEVLKYSSNTMRRSEVGDGYRKAVEMRKNLIGGAGSG